MSILTEQRERRDVQPIPTDADGAAVKFVCGVYRCAMSGLTCRDYHVHAVEFRPENREACIDCPAGIARAKLLGMRGATFNRPEMCQGKTAKGAPCTNAAATDGLCHGCKGNAASRSVGSANARSAAWNGKRKAKAAASVKSAASPKKRPWMVKSGAHGITQTAPAPTCARAGCDRPTVPGTVLSEYCRECVNTAYTSLRKSSGRTPTNAERAEWLASHPAVVKYRRRGAEASAPAEVVAAAPVPVLDVDVAAYPDVVVEGDGEVVGGDVVEVVEVVEVEVDIPPANTPQDADTDAMGLDLATVTFKINGLAFARLQAMAALGIYGDDPNDVARAAVFGWLQGFVWSDM